VPAHPKVVTLDGFIGLDNRHRPEDTILKFLKEAENIDISTSGGIAKRKGYTKVLSGDVTSLWSSNNGLGCYAVVNGDLVRVLDNYSLVTIKEAVGKDKFSFTEVDDHIYFVSKSNKGAIYNGKLVPWGFPKNNISPTITTSIGTLLSGTYQVSFTYVGENGVESGAGIPSVITIPGNKNLNISIPNPGINGVQYARVYCSTPDGTVLYYIGRAELNSTFTISDISTKRPFRLFNVDEPPTGHLIAYYNGRLYIAQDNILWYSEPFQYHHFDLGYNYIEFQEEIRNVLPVEGGVWVSSDKIYYLSGDTPNEFKRVTKEDVKAVPGTETKISGSYLHIDNTPVGYKWLITTDVGIFVLFNQGLIINLTAENIDLDKASKGSSILLKANGNVQYLTILRKEDKPSNTSVGDLVEATIVRNGVNI
jgi:hypothetical protein